MSAETVRQIIARAVAEPEYRGLLLRAPAEAIAGYDLSDAELVALRNLTPANFDSVAAGLEERLSKSGFAMGEANNKLGRGEADVKL